MKRWGIRIVKRIPFDYQKEEIDEEENNKCFSFSYSMFRGITSGNAKTKTKVNVNSLIQNYFENSAVTDTKQTNSSDNIIGKPDDLKTFCFLIGVTVIAVSLLIALVVYIGRKVHHK